MAHFIPKYHNTFLFAQYAYSNQGRDREVGDDVSLENIWEPWQFEVTNVRGFNHLPIRSINVKWVCDGSNILHGRASLFIGTLHRYPLPTMCWGYCWLPGVYARNHLSPPFFGSRSSSLSLPLHIAALVPHSGAVFLRFLPFIVAANMPNHIFGCVTNSNNHARIGMIPWLF